MVSSDSCFRTPPLVQFTAVSSLTKLLSHHEGDMPSRISIAIAALVGLVMIATLYVYWTRTPQYTLLHVLNAYAKGDHEGAAGYIEQRHPLKKRLHSVRRPENIIQHLARLQNETLERAYHLTVKESRIDARSAELHVTLNQTVYRLTFDEQKNGRWKLIDFEKREDFSKQAVKEMKDHPLLIMARL